MDTDDRNGPPQAALTDDAPHQDLSSFVKTSLVDLVAKQIRSCIFSGKYMPGQKLIVRELSEAMGVSHTPVKDALNRLISEGLIEAFPNRSMVVRCFTNDELIENLGVRLMCEVFFADEIVRAAAGDASLIGDLEACLQAMQVAVNATPDINYEAWVDCETRFHRRYMAVCGNNRLATLYNGLDSNRFTYFTFLNNQRIPLTRETLEKNLVEHRAIIAALASGNAQAFRRAVAQHLVRACEDYAIDQDSKEKIMQIKRLAETHGAV